MLSKSPILLIVFLTSFCMHTAATESVRDSLRAVLTEQTGSERLATLVELSNRLVFIAPQEAINLADEAIELAIELRDIPMRFRALKARGYAYGHAGQVTLSMEDLQDGLDYYVRTRDSARIAEAVSDLGNLYQSQGIFDRALEHFQQSLTIRRKIGDLRGIAYSLNNIGSLYWRAGKHDEALDFFMQAIEYFEDAGLDEETAMANTNIGEIYIQINDPDRALEFFNRAITLNQHPGQSIFRAKNLNNIGRVYLQKKEYRRAIGYFNQAMNIQHKAGDMEGFAHSHYNLGMAWLERSELLQALEHFNITTTTSERVKNNDLLIKSLNKSAQIYYQLGQHQNAYEHLARARQLSDSLFSMQQARLTEELRTRYETEKYMIENRNLKLTNQKNEIIIGQQKTVIMLTVGIGLLVLLTVILFLQRRRSSEKLKTIEIEQKLLRSQMNPHFIFNALSMLQNNVLHKTPKENVNLISSMASLMRLILDNSTHEFIAFDKEIQTLKYYLQLQQQRFAGQFAYELNIEPELQEIDFFVPPMLAQPFIENAIEHGFWGIDYQGNIQISFKSGKESVICEILDDGIGFNEGIKQQKDSKHRSYGIDITRQRISILQKKYGMQAALEILDQSENGKQGTLVRIVIPIQLNHTEHE